MDLDAIFNEGFDIEKELGFERSKQLDLASEFIPRTEIEADLKLDGYLRQLGVSDAPTRQTQIDAAVLTAQPPFNTKAGIFKSAAEGWRNGDLLNKAADIRLLEMSGQISPGTSDFLVNQLKSRMTETTPSGWTASMFKSAASLLPMIWDTTKEGLKTGLEVGTVTGIAAAATGVVLGQVPPLTLIPEEIVTVPTLYIAGFGAGFKPGFIVGSAVRGGQLEGAMLYDELLSMKDANGNVIDRTLARRAAYPVMVINGLLELAQINDIIKTIPGGKKLLGRVQRRTVREILRNRRIRDVLFKGATRYATNLGFETFTEIVQEVDTIVVGELAKALSNELDSTDFAQATKDEIVSRIVETAKESLKGFALIAAPGNIITTTGDLIATQPLAPPGPKGVAPAVSRISRLTANPRIQSRINVADIVLERISRTRLAVLEQQFAEQERAAAPELSTEQISAFIEEFQEFTDAEANTTATGGTGIGQQATEAMSNLDLVIRAQELGVEVDDITGKFSESAETRDAARALIQRRITKATRPKPKRSVKQLRKQAAGLNIDTSDIKGKGSAVAIEARIDEAAAQRPLIERGRAPLTPEEQLQLSQTEATLKASEPFIVTPNLYIGNVTARMKKLFADALEISPERIHGFMEEGLAVKRTKIELTVGEARGLLFTLEEGIQERLDNNKIQTHRQMAQINADWGDVKTLREVLGLPKTKRPFRVILAAKTNIVTILNTLERIRKTVTPSAADIVETTQIDRLNNVMRKVAKATTEGFRLGKKEQQEAFAELQYLRKQAQLRTRLVDSIQKPPVKAMEFFYKQAIKDIQTTIDFTATDEEHQRAKRSLRNLVENHPVNAEDIPTELLTTLDQTDIADLTFADLQAINQEIRRLRTLGITKSRLIRTQRTKGRKTVASNLADNVSKARIPRLLKKTRLGIRALGLGPPHIFDMLDGGKNFEGENYDFFYFTTNQNVDAEIHNTNTRHRSGADRMHDLGIRARDLNTKREVGGFDLPTDTLLSIYTGWLNPASQTALRHGGFNVRVKGKDTIVRVTDELHTAVLEALTPAEKAWGDTIIEEYQENYDRLRRATISAENRDLGHEVNYTPIRHTGIEYQSTEQEILDELAERSFYRSAGVQKGFTIDRQNIPPEYLLPVQVGLTRMWASQVRKQEHYINHALHLKDMRAIVNDKAYRSQVKDRFGDPVLKSVESFIDNVANPNFYKAFNEIENISRLLRQHTVIAYLAFNLTTVMKQVPSLAMYWARSSIGDVLISTAGAIRNPRQAYNNALTIHPQLSDRAIEREILEMQQQNPTGYNKIIQRIGRVGLFGLMAMDSAVKTIGINAVFAKEIRQGKSPTQAAKLASQTTLLTQPGFSPKDRARLYSTNEVINWFVQFTNQLNKLYNIGTHDIPNAFRNGAYMNAARSTLALGVMAIMIRMITTGEAPEDAEDAAMALSEQAIASMPIVGPVAASTHKGYLPSAIPPLKAISGLVLAGKAIASGELDKAVQRLWEPVALLLGLPYQGFKNVKKIQERITEEE